MLLKVLCLLGHDVHLGVVKSLREDLSAMAADALQGIANILNLDHLLALKASCPQVPPRRT